MLTRYLGGDIGHRVTRLLVRIWDSIYATRGTTQQISNNSAEASSELNDLFSTAADLRTPADSHLARLDNEA